MPCTNSMGRSWGVRRESGLARTHKSPSYRAKRVAVSNVTGSIASASMAAIHSARFATMTSDTVHSVTCSRTELAQLC